MGEGIDSIVEDESYKPAAPQNTAKGAKCGMKRQVAGRSCLTNFPNQGFGTMARRGGVEYVMRSEQISFSKSHGF